MMNVDFTVQTYMELLKGLTGLDFSFQTVEQFIRGPLGRVVILRHDVDRLPENSLVIAKLEHELGLVATYYFRAVPESWDEGVIREIAGLGHEVGYHYENLTTCGGDFRLAIDDFGINLRKLRKLYPVKTISVSYTHLTLPTN